MGCARGKRRPVRAPTRHQPAPTRRPADSPSLTFLPSLLPGGECAGAGLCLASQVRSPGRDPGRGRGGVSSSGRHEGHRLGYCRHPDPFPTSFKPLKAQQLASPPTTITRGQRKPQNVQRLPQLSFPFPTKTVDDQLKIRTISTRYAQKAKNKQTSSLGFSFD